MANVKPPERYGSCEAGRMAVEGNRTDDGTSHTLVVIHENDGSWTFHGLGAPGVRISKSDAIGIAQGIQGVTLSAADVDIPSLLTPLPAHLTGDISAREGIR